MGKRIDIDVALNGKDNGAVSAVSRLGGALKSAKAEAKASGELSLEKALKRGPEAFAGLFGAGLATFGIEMGARLFEGIGKNLQDIRREFVMGKQDAGAMVDKIAEAVPVLGSVWKAGRELREAFTGEKLQIELINEEAKITTRLFDAQWESAKGMKTTLKGIGEEVRRSKAAQAIALAPTDEKGRALTRDENTRAQEATDNKSIDDAKEDQRKRDAAVIEARKAAVENLQAQFRNKWKTGAFSTIDAEGNSPGVLRSNAEKKELLNDIAQINLAQNMVGQAAKKANDNRLKIESGGDDLRREHAREAATTEIKEERAAAAQRMMARRELQEKAADDEIKRHNDDLENAEKRMTERSELTNQLADAENKRQIDDKRQGLNDQIEKLEKDQGPGKAGFSATMVSSRFQGINSRQDSIQAAAATQRQNLLEAARQQIKAIERLEKMLERSKILGLSLNG